MHGSRHYAGDEHPVPQIVDINGTREALHSYKDTMGTCIRSFNKITASKVRATTILLWNRETGRIQNIKYQEQLILANGV